MPKIRRALISVYDKTGIVEFTQTIHRLGIEILSTGGTARHLGEQGIPTRAISDLTGFPEILAGRVKTLHPKVFGGILARRDDPAQMKQAREHALDLIDLVVVNLYPFEATISREDVSLTDALENIDIGGPSLIRAAAKNFPYVTVVTSPEQYGTVKEELEQTGTTSPETRRRLAAAAFDHTSNYDRVISAYLAEEVQSDPALPPRLFMHLQKVQDLRYGENPHQTAALYRDSLQLCGLLAAKQLHGKELSFNNFMDLDAALRLTRSFDAPCAAIIKHTNPCGVATAEHLVEAFEKAKATDPVSAFGSIIGFNREVDSATAKAVSDMFVEAIIAPAFHRAALNVLKKKKNLRLLETADAPDPAPPQFDLKRVLGGVLVQDQDFRNLSDIDFEVVTDREPTDSEWAALKFGWRVVKYVKSNAIVYARADRTIGIGAGQMSRVDSSLIAVQKAARIGLDLKGTAVASDAFFPFRDGVDAAADAGATAVVQPGGSIRDEEVVQAANEHNMAMVFTGVRHFRH